ncbi:MAG: sugar phosphate isomerase/epimerase family protein [Syntrophobacteraceae bacterium]
MSFHRSIQFAVQSGFEGIEIWSNAFDFWPRTVTSKEIEHIKSVARENHLAMAVHFCTINNNLADLNPGHLNESMNQLKETIRLCRRIGGRLVIIHPGTFSEISPDCERLINPKFTPAVLRQAAIERFKKSLKEAASFAESHDVLIGIENFSAKSNCLLTTIEDIAEWVDGVNSPALKITLDIGHANIYGGVDKVIDILGGRIVHLHLHDNDGVSADHAELGTGTIDWEAAGPFLRSFQGMLSIEVLDRKDPEGAILRSKSFLGRLLAGK